MKKGIEILRQAVIIGIISYLLNKTVRETGGKVDLWSKGKVISYYSKFQGNPKNFISYKKTKSLYNYYTNTVKPCIVKGLTNYAYTKNIADIQRRINSRDSERQNNIMDYLHFTYERLINNPNKINNPYDIPKYFGRISLQKKRDLIRVENTYNRALDNFTELQFTYEPLQKCQDGINFLEYKYFLQAVYTVLDKKQKVIFNLYYVKSFSMSQIGDKKGVSKVAIFKQLKKIEGKLLKIKSLFLHSEVNPLAQKGFTKKEHEQLSNDMYKSMPSNIKGLQALESEVEKVDFIDETVKLQSGKKSIFKVKNYQDKITAKKESPKPNASGKDSALWIAYKVARSTKGVYVNQNFWIYLMVNMKQIEKTVKAFEALNMPYDNMPIYLLNDQEINAIYERLNERKTA